MLPGATLTSPPPLLQPTVVPAAPARRSVIRLGGTYPFLAFTPLVARRSPPGLYVSSGSLWEAPVDGYDSEYDEDKEEEEEEVSGGDGEEGAAAVASQYEELVREVELLLGPEEKSILQQNEVPNLSKISTAKWSPLHSLALSIQIPVMDKLLEYGTDIDSVDKDGCTALHRAVMGKKEAVISHLLRKGANPHIKDRDGAAPLHYAVQVGATQTVKLLIKYKVDVNVTDNDGWTPLHVAVQSRSRDVVKVLVVHGADKTIRNKDGKSPLDLSLCYGRDFKSYDLAKLLKLVPVNRRLKTLLLTPPPRPFFCLAPTWAISEEGRISREDQGH